MPIFKAIAFPPKESLGLWRSCCGLPSLARAQGEASKAAYLSVGYSGERDIISMMLAGDVRVEHFFVLGLHFHLAGAYSVAGDAENHNGYLAP